MKINKNIPHCHDITEILKVALNTVILTHTVGTVPKPNAKIEGDKIDTTVTNTQNITAHFPGLV